MATQPKSVPQTGRTSLDLRRIARLAEQAALFNAQRWFARERTWINEQHLQLCRIPAATFFEQQRAEWFRNQLASLGWDTKLDRAGNVLAVWGGAVDSSREFVVSAHLDTVLAPRRPEEIHSGPDGRMFGPGVSDNGSGLSALLSIGRVLAETSELHDLASAVLLVANVGEEGEGNLSGMRYLCRQFPVSSVKAFIVLDGPSTDHITAQALASRRYEISFGGPGGHSWNDYGIPNPVHALCAAASSFIQAAEVRNAGDRKERCSFNFGIIEGGTSINSIPSSARAKLDLRSEEPGLLEGLANLLSEAVERTIERENRPARSGRLTAKIKELGSRPGGRLPEDSNLLQTVQAVDAYLNIRSRIDCASTDANVPLSIGHPAISIGAGGQGGGAHTNQEWYQPEGRELGLRRILLLLAALAEQSFSSPHLEAARRS